MIIINNQLKVAKLKISFIISFFLSIGFIIPIFVTHYITIEYYVMFIIGVLLAFYLLYLNLIKPEYIYMAEVKGSLQIKNYPARPILRTYKAYEIKLSTLHHFEISKTFYNKTSLTIWVKTKKGSGNYPPLSLSALSGEEQKKLSKYLSKHTSERRKNKISFK